MNALATCWRLVRVEITDLLGFQGAKEFNFKPGLQVLEASNHTGKTSLTLSLLWGMTGVIPNLSRINKKSFRLTNKHAGENAKPSVSIWLKHDDGKCLHIHRLYNSRPDPDKDLTVELEDQTAGGEPAQGLIFSELGVKAESLEGCGVVLQDHRLGLITGKESDISDVINDMLGLYTLSQLVPVLEEGKDQAVALEKEIKNHLMDADPLQKWEERNIQLAEEFRQLENKAVAAGFSPETLENPQASALAQLAEVAQVLGAAPSTPGTEIVDEVGRLRATLAAARKSGNVSGELAALQVQKNQAKQRKDAAQELSADWGDHAVKLQAKSAEGEMNAQTLTAAVVAADEKLTANANRRSQLQEENSFLTASYNHLLKHLDEKNCPLCQQSVEPTNLRVQVKNRIEGKIAAELEALVKNDEQTKEQKKTAEKRLSLVKALRKEHDDLVKRLHPFADPVNMKGAEPLPAVEGEKLFLEAGARSALAAHLDKMVVQLTALTAKATADLEAKQAACAQQETDIYQPAETKINRVSELLAPIIAAAGKIEAHGKKRETAEKKQTELKDLQDEAAALAGQLKRVNGALAEHEQKAASAAVKAQLPQISKMFHKIAGNPDYDALDIQTNVNRDRVAYKIQATSSLMGNLNDAVGHVLSEGDLSSASMALLLGLAAGRSHHLGFLVLDDPAQGMDETLQANLAGALAGLGVGKQVIILTHQRGFAEALKTAGAAHDKLPGWKLGRLAHA